jgi:hypothetical protein
MRPPRNATARSSTIAAPHPLVAQRHLVILPVAWAEKLPADVGSWSSPHGGGAAGFGEADCLR